MTGPCETWGGSGAAPGTQPKRCERCEGRGVDSESQGFFSIAKTCHVCQGTGRVIETPCGDCRGLGQQEKPRQLTKGGGE